MPVFTFMGENMPVRAAQSVWNERNTDMKSVEEMNAMEVCAYLVAKTAGKEIDNAEIRRLYDIHCAKLKKELAEKNVGKVSDEFKKELAGNRPTGENLERSGA